MAGLKLALIAVVLEAFTESMTCPQQCSCTSDGLSVSCHGDPTAYNEAVESLPTNVTDFTFVINAATNNVSARALQFDHARFSHFDVMKSFSLRGMDRGQSAYYIKKSHINKLRPWPGCGMTVLEKLQMNLKWYEVPPGVEDIKCLQSLRVLDLSYAESESFSPGILEWLPEALAHKPLEILLLRAVQSITYEDKIVKTLDFERLLVTITINTAEGARPE